MYLMLSCIRLKKNYVQSDYNILVKYNLLKVKSLYLLFYIINDYESTSSYFLYIYIYIFIVYTYTC